MPSHKPAVGFRIRALVAVLALVALPCAPLVAQDAPPAASESKDPTGLVAVQVPVDWRPQDLPVQLGVTMYGALGGWSGALKTPTGPVTASLDVLVSRESRRAVQVLTRLALEFPPVAETRRSGAGWIEQAFGPLVGHTYWIRCIERAGLVVVVRVRLQSTTGVADAGAEVAKLLDSVRVVADPEPPEPPMFATMRKAGGFEVWAAGAEATEIDAIVKALAPWRAMVLKEMGKKPVDASVPVVWMFDDADAFDVCARTGDWQVQRHSAPQYLPHARAIGVLRGSAAAARDLNLAGAAIDQALSQWFGGAAPAWLGDGLARWFAWAAPPDLDPDHPNAKSVAVVKEAATERAFRFEPQFARTLFEIRKAGDAAVPRALHWFLRSTQETASWQKAYQASLTAARDTGDPAAVGKAWDGADFAAMEKAFAAWLANR